MSDSATNAADIPASESNQTTTENNDVPPSLTPDPAVTEQRPTDPSPVSPEPTPSSPDLEQSAGSVDLLANDGSAVAFVPKRECEGAKSPPLGESLVTGLSDGQRATPTTLLSAEEDDEDEGEWCDADPGDGVELVWRNVGSPPDSPREDFPSFPPDPAPAKATARNSADSPTALGVEADEPTSPRPRRKAPLPDLNAPSRRSATLDSIVASLYTPPEGDGHAQPDGGAVDLGRPSARISVKSRLATPNSDDFPLTPPTAGGDRRSSMNASPVARATSGSPSSPRCHVIRPLAEKPVTPAPVARVAAESPKERPKSFTGGPTDVVRAGHLHRRGAKWRQAWNWKRKWFVLTGGEMKYGPDLNKLNKSEPLERIARVSLCYHRGEVGSRNNCFAVHTPDRIYYLSAEDNDSRLAWLEAFKSVLGEEVVRPFRQPEGPEATGATPAK